MDPDKGESDFTVLRKVFNDWYARDTSRKIRAVKRAQGMSGRPLTSHAPYGCILGEDGRFVADPETAPVVKQIFSLCVAGYGPTKIARMLCEQYIPTPGTGEMKKRYGFIYVDKTDDGKGSLKRQPKKPLWWYKRAIESHGECLE